VLFINEYVYIHSVHTIKLVQIRHYDAQLLQTGYDWESL
jgi:hypothetical protein